MLEMEAEGRMQIKEEITDDGIKIEIKEEDVA